MTEAAGTIQGGVDFALLGHVDTWDSALRVFKQLRGESGQDLDQEILRGIFPYIPARTMFRVELCSHPGGRLLRGLYIDTFISPDELKDPRPGAKLEKIRSAARCAVEAGARVCVLGGFTSIALEGDLGLLGNSAGTVFTTGNSLTAAYCVKGLERAAEIRSKRLEDCSLLVVGATGDVGSACVDYFAGKVRELLLCARNLPRLERQAQGLRSRGFAARAGVSLEDMLPTADLIILAASAAEAFVPMDACKEDVLVCDAGYPFNAVGLGEKASQKRVFAGGMGSIKGGYECRPDLRRSFNFGLPPDPVRGCLLEGIVLAMEGRRDSFSYGRGRISSERIEEIWDMALRHGFPLAPFFYGRDYWDIQPAVVQAEVPL